MASIAQLGSARRLRHKEVADKNFVRYLIFVHISHKKDYGIETAFRDMIADDTGGTSLPTWSK
jgi:hypothetical protein